MALLLALLTAICLLGDAASAAAAAAPSKVTVSVVGFAECLDCADSKGSASNVDAFKDIHVDVLCKASDGKWVKKGSSRFSSGGELAVEVSNDILGVDGSLKTECIAQLSASSRLAPCPVLANKGPEHFRVVHQSKDEAAGTVVLAISSEKLTFSRAPCSAAFWFPLPWPHPWFKPCPPPFYPSPSPSPSPPTPSPSPPTPSPTPPTPSPSPPTPSPSPPITPPFAGPSPPLKRTGSPSPRPRYVYSPPPPLPRKRSPSPSPRSTYRYSSPPPPTVKPPVKKPCPPVHKPKPPPPPPPPYKPYVKSGPLS